jgi:hypothetical protein
MAESTPTADATSDTGATPVGVAEAVPAPETASDLGDGGKRALAELRRELKDIRAERDELATAKRVQEDAERSELEKATRDRDEHKTARTALELKVMKMQAAIDAGIPGQWMRLNGTDLDELTKDAKAFAESLGTGNASSTNGNQATPAELGAGPRPGAPATGSAGFSQTLRERARGR